MYALSNEPITAGKGFDEAVELGGGGGGEGGLDEAFVDR